MAQETSCVQLVAVLAMFLHRYRGCRCGSLECRDVSGGLAF